MATTDPVPSITYEQYLREFLDWQKADGANRLALTKANADRIAAQDDARNALIERQAAAAEKMLAMPSGDRRAELVSIVRDLIGKRVTSTSVITGATVSPTSHASATNLAADALAIQAAVDKVLA